MAPLARLRFCEVRQLECIVLLLCSYQIRFREVCQLECIVLLLCSCQIKVCSDS